MDIRTFKVGRLSKVDGGYKNFYLFSGEGIKPVHFDAATLDAAIDFIEGYGGWQLYGTKQQAKDGMSANEYIVFVFDWPLQPEAFLPKNAAEGETISCVTGKPFVY